MLVFIEPRYQGETKEDYFVLMHKTVVLPKEIIFFFLTQLVGSVPDCKIPLKKIQELFFGDQ